MDKLLELLGGTAMVAFVLFQWAIMIGFMWIGFRAFLHLFRYVF